MDFLKNIVSGVGTAISNTYEAGKDLFSGFLGNVNSGNLNRTSLSDPAATVVPSLSNPTFTVPSITGGQTTPAAILPTQPLTYNSGDVYQPAGFPNPIPKPGTSPTNLNVGAAPLGITSNTAPFGQSGTIRPLIPPAPGGGNTGSTLPGLSTSNPLASAAGGAAPRYTPTPGTPGAQGTSVPVGSTASALPGGGFSFGGTQGASGDSGGGSNKTGLLGAAGGLGTGSVGETIISPEEQRKKDLQILQTDLTKTTSGNLARLTNGSVIDTSTGQVIGNSTFNAGPSFNAAIPKQPFSVDQIINGTAQQSLKDLQASGASLSKDDFLKLYTDTIATAKTELARLQALPENPVVETPEQDAFVNSQPQDQQTAIRQAMDAARTKYNMPTLEKSQVDLMQTINATNEAFQKIIADIKDNPNLPKGLAARRITEFTKTNSITIQNLLGQLDVVKTQISQGNDLVNREFQIQQLGLSEQNRQQDNARANLSLLISSKAIAGMSDKDLEKYAQQTGISINDLKSIRTTMTDKVADATNIHYEQKGTDLTVIGMVNGKPTILGTLKGVAQAPAATADQKSSAEISSITNQLNTSKGKDGFVDPGVFTKLRTSSQMGPDEFNKRFGNLLSEQEQARLGIKSGGTTTPYLTNDFITSKVPTASLYTQAKAAGYSAGFFSGEDGQKQAVNDYLNKVLQPQINQYRAAGFSDDVISKMLGLI